MPSVTARIEGQAQAVNGAQSIQLGATQPVIDWLFSAQEPDNPEIIFPPGFLRTLVKPAAVLVPAMWRRDP